MKSIWGCVFGMLSIINSNVPCPYVIVGLNYSHLGPLERQHTHARTDDSHLHIHHVSQAVNKKGNIGSVSHRGNVMNISCKGNSGSLNNRVTHKDRSNTCRPTYTHTYIQTCTHMHASTWVWLWQEETERTGMRSVFAPACLRQASNRRHLRTVCLHTFPR